MKINNVGVNLVNRNNYVSHSRNNSSNKNVQRNEVVVINRRPSFTAGGDFPEAVIKRFGLNMECLVGKKAVPTSYEPAPETLEKGVLSYFHELEVDWRTHVDPAKTKRRFE